MRGAVFDLDGLLIDSEPLWRRAEQATFSRLGIHLTDADCERTMGLRCDEAVAYWRRLRPWAGVPDGEVVADIESRVCELIRTSGRPLAGVTRTIEQLTAAGIALAVASSSSTAVIATALEAIALDGRFRAVCSAMDEIRGKPDPAVYRTAVRRLGLPAAACVAFEDSEAGVTAARAAGLWVVAVPAAHQRGLPGFAAADLELRSLSDFGLDLMADWPEESAATARPEGDSGLD